MYGNRDIGLYVRMALVMLLMGALYVGFAVALAMYFGSFVGIALAVAIMSALQLIWGHKLALKSMNGAVVDEQSHPELYARVRRLSQQAGLPMPDVAVAETKMPNAFAAGRSTNTAVVCVTTGLLDVLDDEQLDGVIAHELAHIRNHDMAIMTIASSITTMAYMIVRWGWLFNDDKANQHILPAIAGSLVVWVTSSPA